MGSVARAASLRFSFRCLGCRDFNGAKASCFDAMPEYEVIYVNVREFLGHFIGRKVVDITQHDKGEFAATKKSFIMLMFDDGGYLKVYIGDDGFHHSSSDDSLADDPEE